MIIHTEDFLKSQINGVVEGWWPKTERQREKGKAGQRPQIGSLKGVSRHAVWRL